MNARNELLEDLKVVNGEIKCAHIRCHDNDYILKVGHSEQEKEDFLNFLNFKYNAGYGGQELFGTIWATEFEWFTRGEYDGSEWWVYHVYPTIPKELL